MSGIFIPLGYTQVVIKVLKYPFDCLSQRWDKTKVSMTVISSACQTRQHFTKLQKLSFPLLKGSWKSKLPIKILLYTEDNACHVWATFDLLSSKSLRSSTNSLFFDGQSKLHQTSFIWNAHIFLFGLILQDIPNSISPQNTLHLLPTPVGLLVLSCLLFPPPPPTSALSFPVPDRGAGLPNTCAHDRRALQQLVLNVHVKHSDLTCYITIYLDLVLGQCSVWITSFIVLLLSEY